MYSPYEEPITQKTANVVVSDKQKKLSTTYMYTTMIHLFALEHKTKYITVLFVILVGLPSQSVLKKLKKNSPKTHFNFYLQKKMRI